MVTLYKEKYKYMYYCIYKQYFTKSYFYLTYCNIILLMIKGSLRIFFREQDPKCSNKFLPNNYNLHVQLHVSNHYDL